MLKVNYIAVFYLGRRRVDYVNSNPRMIDRHLDYLQNNNCPIARVTIVLNADNQEHVEAAAKRISRYKDYYTELKVVIRQNVGHSYGGWNDIVNSSIERGEDFTHFFLIEDDYAPSRPDFIEFLLEDFESDDKKIGYVCQKVSGENENRHAGASSGLMLAAAARAAHKKYGSAFKILPSGSYTEAQSNQVNFLKYMEQCGYEYTDPSDRCSTLFAERGKVKFLNVFECGNPISPPFMKPILDV